MLVRLMMHLRPCAATSRVGGEPVAGQSVYDRLAGGRSVQCQHASSSFHLGATAISGAYTCTARLIHCGPFL